MVISAGTIVSPLVRAFGHAQINYNEGWNLYNAERVAAHQPLYAAAYDWTTVNYPALSFHLLATFSRHGNEALLAARILSLLGLFLSALWAGLIVKQASGCARAAWFSAMFLIAVFCATASSFVGADDPHLIAQAFFLAGFYLYQRTQGQGLALEAVAVLFIVGGNLKHNPIEFPLAVLLDLLLHAPWRALRFALVGGVLAALSAVLTLRHDGAAYLDCLLAPRGYLWLHILTNWRAGLLGLLLPAAAAVWLARRDGRQPRLRLPVLLLGCALVADSFFAGGAGVAVNSMFGTMVAIVLLSGIFLAGFERLPAGRVKALGATAVGGIFFLGLVVIMFRSGWRNPFQFREEQRLREENYARFAEFLRQQPGDALCESLLQCHAAGKPYLYDPFNATRFVAQGRLDPEPMVDRLRQQQFGAVQMDNRIEWKLARRRPDSHFSPAILQAIAQFYQVGMATEDGVIYVPRR